MVFVFGTINMLNVISEFAPVRTILVSPLIIRLRHSLVAWHIQRIITTSMVLFVVATRIVRVHIIVELR